MLYMEDCQRFSASSKETLRVDGYSVNDHLLLMCLLSYKMCFFNGELQLFIFSFLILLNLLLSVNAII